MKISSASDSEPHLRFNAICMAYLEYFYFQKIYFYLKKFMI